MPASGDALSHIIRDDIRGAVTWFVRPKDYQVWLVPPLLSGSPPCVAPFAFFTFYAISSKMATRVDYGIPGDGTTFLDVPEVCRAPITGLLCPCTLRDPKPLGSRNCLRLHSTVVLFFPLSRPWAVRFFSFVLRVLKSCQVILNNVRETMRV